MRLVGRPTAVRIRGGASTRSAIVGLRTVGRLTRLQQVGDDRSLRGWSRCGPEERDVLVLATGVDQPDDGGALLVGRLQVDLDVEAPVMITGRVVEDLPHPPDAGLA